MLEKDVKDYRGSHKRRICPKCRKKTLGIFYCWRCKYSILKSEKH